jgi:hypothetical protein
LTMALAMALGRDAYGAAQSGSQRAAPFRFARRNSRTSAPMSLSENSPMA